MPGRLRRALLALALGVASLMGSIVLAEAVFRFYERHFLVEEVRIGADDFDLAKLGYNDAEGYVAAAREKGAFRILSFGDSFAESATRGPYAYAAVMERALSESSGRRVRVVNLGISKSTFQDYLQEERTWGERVEHDAVLFNLYAGNDFAEVPQSSLFVRGVARAPLRRGDEELRLVGPAVDVPRRYPLRLLDYVRAHYLTQTQVEAPAEEKYRPRMPFAPPAYYVRTQASAARYYGAEPLDLAYAGSLYGLDMLVSRAAALERQGVRVALSVAPPDFVVSREWLDPVLAALGLSEGDLRLDLPEQVVAALAQRHGFEGPVVVFQACLREAERLGQDTYYKTNTHWSVRGNEIVGRVFAERLAAAWNLGGVAPGEAPPPCASDPPAPSPDVRRWLDASLPRLETAANLRNRVGDALADQPLSSFEHVAEALTGAGMQLAPERIEGVVDSASAEGVGRVPIHVHGFAHDAKDPASWLLVVLVWGGELRGVGMTPQDALEGAFGFDVLEDVNGPLWGGHVLAVAIAPDGAFAELPVERGLLFGGSESR